jgi:hypothetical protein
MLNIKFGAVGAGDGAASLYSSGLGSTKMILLLAAAALQIVTLLLSLSKSMTIFKFVTV